MARRHKWLNDVAPGRPVSEAARVAVRRRIAAVRHYLPLAARRAEEDDEYVHQLRVASRRAIAALDVFSEVVPRRRARRLKRKLKRLRRAAGAARDFDVLHQRIVQHAESSGTDASSAYWTSILGTVRSRRVEAQRPIVQMYRRWKRRGVKRLVSAVMRAIRWRGDCPEPSLEESARRAIAPRAAAFFKAASGDWTDPAALHATRILGKKLRYAMELFSGAFSPPFRRDLYPELEAIQSRLGEIVDHWAAREIYRDWAKQFEERATRECFADLAKTESAAADAAIDDLRTWWTDQRRGDLVRLFDQVTLPAHGDDDDDDDDDDDGEDEDEDEDEGNAAT